MSQVYTLLDHVNTLGPGASVYIGGKPNTITFVIEVSSDYIGSDPPNNPVYVYLEQAEKTSDPSLVWSSFIPIAVNPQIGTSSAGSLLIFNLPEALYLNLRARVVNNVPQAGTITAKLYVS